MQIRDIVVNHKTFQVKIGDVCNKSFHDARYNLFGVPKFIAAIETTINKQKARRIIVSSIPFEFTEDMKVQLIHSLSLLLARYQEKLIEDPYYSMHSWHPDLVGTTDDMPHYTQL